MWKHTANVVDAEYWFLVRVVAWGLHILVTKLLADFLCQSGVDGVPRLCSHDATFQRTANQRKVAEKVEQFVACWLILIYQRLVVEIAQLAHLLAWHVHQVGKTVEVFFRHFLIVDNDSVVEVATFNEVHLQQRKDFANENECAACRNLTLESRHMLKRCKLIAQNWRIKFNHHVHRQFIIGEDNQRRTGFGVKNLDTLLHHIVFLFLFLLLNAYFFNFIAVDDCATVENWEFGCIHLNQAVVDAGSVEGCQCVLDGAHLHILVGFARNHSATGCFGHVFGKGFNDRLAFQVDALNSVSCVHLGRFESGSHMHTCMQSLAANGELAF